MFWIAKPTNRKVTIHPALASDVLSADGHHARMTFGPAAAEIHGTPSIQVACVPAVSTSGLKHIAYPVAVGRCILIGMLIKLVLV